MDKIDAGQNRAPQSENTSPKLEHVVLQQRWDTRASEVNSMVDKLGKGIDEGIKEPVIALNLLGVNTLQSCEGHLEWATGAPYIDIGSPNTDDLRRKVSEASERAENARTQHSPDTDEGSLWIEYHTATRELAKENLKEAKKIVGYLNEFYETRSVPADQRLVVNGNYQFTRLESQGALFQQTEEPEVKAVKLKIYQEEMKAFSDFLKGKFFGETTAPSTSQTLVNS